LPPDCDVIELAEAFGQVPETIVDEMSEYWFNFALVYLSERSRAKPEPKGGRGGPAPEPDQEELDDKGRWYLTG
jgi:hypothetical protein